jgi:hypothetical protein
MKERIIKKIIIGILLGYNYRIIRYSFDNGEINLWVTRSGDIFEQVNRVLEIKKYLPIEMQIFCNNLLEIDIFV